MPDWTFLALPFLISTILIYFASESESQVKSYEYLNFSIASFFSISSVSIYYWPESNIRVKSYGCLNLPCASMFNLEHHDIFCSWIWHRSEILWLFEFFECFRCSILFILIYYWPESDIRVESYAHLNLLCASIFNFSIYFARKSKSWVKS